MDDWGNHILVDDDYNITGIIDWEWTQTVPWSIAFAAPYLLPEHLKYILKYIRGDNALSDDEEPLLVSLKPRESCSSLMS